MITLKVDDKNNLILTETVREKFFRKEELDNRVFSTETTRRESAGREELKRIKLSGEWDLTEEHDLKLQVSGTDSRFFGKSLILRGELVKLKSNSILFRVRQSDTLSGLRTSNIQLSGKWQADQNNRLCFKISKASGSEDTLTFNGRWDVGPNNYIEYRFQSVRQTRQRKRFHSLVLKGWWQIGNDRLIYRLHKNIPGGLVIRASMQSRSLRAQDGIVKYQIGIEFEQKGLLKKEKIDITIFGQWKINKDLTVGFYVKYGIKKVESVRLNIKTMIAEGAFLECSVNFDAEGSSAFDISFTKRVVPDLILFLRLSRLEKTNRITGGVTIKF